MGRLSARTGSIGHLASIKSCVPLDKTYDLLYACCPPLGTFREHFVAALAILRSRQPGIDVPLHCKLHPCYSGTSMPLHCKCNSQHVFMRLPSHGLLAGAMGRKRRRNAFLRVAPDGLGPRGAPMLGGVRMMWPGSAPLVSGMPGSLLPGDTGMPMYFRARSSMPAAGPATSAP